MSARAVRIVLGICCTAFFLAIALYRVPLREVGTSLAHVDPIWIGAALLIYAVNLALRAWRWQIILRPLEAISYPTVARALLVGYGLNTILPARLGELFRAEFLKQSLGVSRVWALTSIVIERLFDGMTVVACLGIGLIYSAALGQTAKILIEVLVTAAVVFGVTLCVAIFLARTPMPRALDRFPRLSAQIRMVQRGFEVLRTWRILEIAALTLILYIPDTLSLWCVVKSVGLQLNLAGALVLVGAASLSTLVPSAPAFLGTMQLAYALAIESAGGSRATGIAAATLAQSCLLFPTALIAVGILVQRSGSILRFMPAKGNTDAARTDP